MAHGFTTVDMDVTIAFQRAHALVKKKYFLSALGRRYQSGLIYSHISRHCTPLLKRNRVSTALNFFLTANINKYMAST